jgi:hypothetical protein
MPYKRGYTLKLPRDWLKELETLLARLSGYGVSADLYALTMVELQGVYMYLKALSERA